LLAKSLSNLYVAMQQRLRRLFFGDDIQAFIAETGSAQGAYRTAAVGCEGSARADPAGAGKGRMARRSAGSSACSESSYRADYQNRNP
jgi:hypothetical protein